MPLTLESPVDYPPTALLPQGRTDGPFALVAVLLVTCACKAEVVGRWLATAALGVGAYLLRTAGIALLAAWV